jgi:hypothetical protein
MPSHAVAFEQTPWMFTHTRATGMSMDLLHAMRSALAGEMVPLDDTLKPAPLSGAGDVNSADPLKDGNCDLLPDFEARHRAPQFTNEPLGLAVRFGGQLDAGSGAALRTFAADAGNVTAFGATGLAGARPGSLGTLLVGKT